MDKNPLAVELCKVALWLEAHNPGEPLNFLDHHIKWGDAIVGLAHKEELENGIADDAFKKMPGDNKDIRAELAKRNKRERKDRKQRHFDFGKTVEGSFADISMMFDRFNRLPENTIEEIEYKRKEYVKMTAGAKWLRLKTLADIQVAQFFIPKDEINAKKIVTDEEYLDYLSWKPIHPMKAGKAGGIAGKKRFFHWFLEFPEVFARGGFDCILGNPPFLGGQSLSGSFGQSYLNWLKSEFSPIGSTDLVVYFFRRIYNLIKDNGFQSLISTNSIAQGKIRKFGLDVIKNNDGSINFAIKSTQWPGQAAVFVSLVCIFKGKWHKDCFLNNKLVNQINSLLEDNADDSIIYKLKINRNKSFQGHIPLGEGFIITEEKAKELISTDYKNKEVIFPYLIGQNINNNQDQKASRYAIYFDERDEDEAKMYQEPYKIIEKAVKPERIIKDAVKYPRMVYEWWKFWNNRQELSSAIHGLNRVLVHTKLTKTHGFIFVKPEQIFSDLVIIFSLITYSGYCYLQSTIHENWAWHYGSTFKGDRRYSPTLCFETFPFPQKLSGNLDSELNNIGSKYHGQRQQLMLNLKIGLTKTYNLFHSKGLSVEDIIKRSKESQEICEKGYKDILKLRELHKQMDETVLKAYGWQDIDLAHDFYEADYLPENDSVRYTISPEARKEGLKRLLKLNHEIHEQEVKTGLHAKGKSKKKKSKNKQKADATEQMKLF